VIEPSSERLSAANAALDVGENRPLSSRILYTLRLSPNPIESAGGGLMSARADIGRTDGEEEEVVQEDIDWCRCCRTSRSGG
jgi:hypothetical protein